jgi:hypothetical protein
MTEAKINNSLKCDKVYLTTLTNGILIMMKLRMSCLEEMLDTS